MAHRCARVAAHLVGSRRAETAAGRAAGGNGRSAPCRPLRGPAEHREPDRMPHRAPGRPPGRRGGFARDLRRCRPPRRRGRRLGGRRRRHARRRTIPGRAPRPAPGDRGRRVAAGGELRRCQQSPSAGGGRPGRGGATGRWRPGRVGRLRAAGRSGPGAVRARRGDRRRQRAGRRRIARTAETSADHLQGLLRDTVAQEDQAHLSSATLPRAVSAIAAAGALRVLAVDLGARGAIRALAEPDGSVASRLHSSGGLAGIAHVAGAAGRVARLAPEAGDEAAVADLVQTMRARPETLPQSVEELAGVQAAARIAAGRHVRRRPGRSGRPAHRCRANDRRRAATGTGGSDAARRRASGRRHAARRRFGLDPRAARLAPGRRARRGPRAPRR